MATVVLPALAGIHVSVRMYIEDISITARSANTLGFTSDVLMNIDAA